MMNTILKLNRLSCSRLSSAGLTSLPQRVTNQLYYQPCFNPTTNVLNVCGFHTSTRRERLFKFERIPRSLSELTTDEHKDWLSFNDIVYPPSKEDEPLRPAEVTHLRHTVKYSRKKLWYICLMIRGMSVDEARKQLTFYNRKGALIMKEVVDEAVSIACTDHNVEYRSNLWICDVFAKDGLMFKGWRRSRGGVYFNINYRHCDIYIRLREGRPPKYHYTPMQTGHEHLRDYLKEMRGRRIYHGL